MSDPLYRSNSLFSDRLQLAADFTSKSGRAPAGYFPAGGLRQYTGTMYGFGSYGGLAQATWVGQAGVYLAAFECFADVVNPIGNAYRVEGLSVRCLQE